MVINVLNAVNLLTTYILEMVVSVSCYLMKELKERVGKRLETSSFTL